MKFQVGDRIAIYGPQARGGDGKVVGSVMDRVTGVVTSYQDYLLQFIDDSGGGCEYEVHPRQCRRLIKKKRRRVWIPPWVLKNNSGAGEFIQTIPPLDLSFVEFIEVLTNVKK